MVLSKPIILYLLQDRYKYSELWSSGRAVWVRPESPKLGGPADLGTSLVVLLHLKLNMICHKAQAWLKLWLRIPYTGNKRLQKLSGAFTTKEHASYLTPYPQTFRAAVSESRRIIAKDSKQQGTRS